MLTGGSVFGEYRLLSPLGRGPRARVWVATRIDREERVALKIIDTEKTPAVARKRDFEALVRAITRVGRKDHANLPGVYGTAVSNDDGAFALATEYFDGGPFQKMGHLGDPMVLDRVLHLLIQLGTLLSWLHLDGVAHGNVKPSNVLVTPGTYGPTIKLLDLCWSVAGLGGVTDRAFVSPEASVGEPIDALTDQWATARLLHQLAVTNVGSGKSPTQALAALPLAVLRVMKRAMENSPRARYQSMAAFVQALEHAREEVLDGEERPHAVREPTLPIALEERTAPHPVVGRGAVETAPGMPAVDTDDFSTAESPTEATPAVRLPQQRADMHAPQPVALGSINPSADAHQEPTPYPSIPPVTAQDPTDRFSAVETAPKKPWVAMVVIVLSIVAIAGAVWWVATAPDLVAPSTVASAPPNDPPTKAPPVEPPPPAKAPPQDAPPPPAKAPPVEPPPPAKAQPASPSGTAKFEASCRRGSTSACMALGSKYQRGDGVTKNLKTASKWYERACRLRKTSACLEAGSLLVEIGDAKRARRVYERACDSRSASACERLSELYRRGLGGTKSTRNAEAFRRRACQLGLRRACG